MFALDAVVTRVLVVALYFALPAWPARGALHATGSVKKEVNGARQARMIIMLMIVMVVNRSELTIAHLPM